MKRDQPPAITEIAECDDELKRQQSQNDALTALLRKMEHLWPEEERGRVQSLLRQTEATKTVLDDCARQLEEKRRG